MSNLDFSSLIFLLSNIKESDAIIAHEGTIPHSRIGDLFTNAAGTEMVPSLEDVLVNNSTTPQKWKRLDFAP